MNADNRQTTAAQSARSGDATVSGCCGGPAPEGTSACCAQDAAVKSTGGSGCGCGSQPRVSAPPKNRCCS